jgi:hypothetical protein
MRYPITNFMDGRGQWWYINAAFNEPPKKEIARCKIWRTGWPREKVLFSICSSTFDPALWKNTIEKHSLKLAPRPRSKMRSELLVAHEKRGQLPQLTVYVVPV